MKNADMPAMPVVDSCGRPAMYGADSIEAFGLTKREMMAMHMMASIQASDGLYYHRFESMAKDAAAMADALLAELEKQQ